MPTLGDRIVLAIDRLIDAKLKYAEELKLANHEWFPSEEGVFAAQVALQDTLNEIEFKERDQ